jgi:lipid-A-disaccharide synthase-like uncharacterized protein
LIRDKVYLGLAGRRDNWSSTGPYSTVKHMMGKETRKPTNVARPTSYWKLVGWVGLLFLSAMLYMTVWQPEEMEFTSARERTFFVAFFSFMLLGTLYLLAYACGAYYWCNDEEVGYKLFFHNQSMRWDEIVGYRVSGQGSAREYVLTDAEGRRLRITLAIKSPGSAFYGVLSDKLARFGDEESSEIESQLKEVELSGHNRFRVGIGAGSYTVHGDLLIHEYPLRAREITLGEVEYVYKSGLKAETGVTLVSTNGAWVRIRPETKRYRVLLAYIKRRTKKALWIDTRGPEPSPRRAKIAYLKLELESLRAITMSPGGIGLLAFCCAGLVAISAWPVVRFGESDDWDWSNVMRVAVVCLMILLGIFAWSASQARKSRRLEARIASLEAEEDAAKDNERKRIVTKEDGE